MILVFGGTTEGKQAIEVLETLQLPYFYSTKTNIKVDLRDYGKYRFGAFSEDELTQFITEKQVLKIIHASHPFAIELHRTISNVAKKCGIAVFRLERQYPKHSNHKNVHYVNGYNEALEILNERFIGKTLLGLTGVQTIEKLKNFWSISPSYFRILDRASSIEIAMESNFPKDQLILGYPNTSVKDEIALIKKNGVEVIITKESGKSGSLQVKIDAAIECDIPIIILKRPALPGNFQFVKNKVELAEALQKSKAKL